MRKSPEMLRKSPDALRKTQKRCENFETRCENLNKRCRSLQKCCGSHKKRCGSLKKCCGSLLTIGGLNGLKAPYLGAFIPKLGFSASIHTHHSTYSTPNQFLKRRRYYGRKKRIFQPKYYFWVMSPFFSLLL